MWIETLLLFAGLTLLLVGGESLVRGASAIATRAGISPVIIGLTVAAFGTSAPELAVSVSGALNGQADITFGNIIGSNIANVGLLLGMTALIRPLAVHGLLIRREIPMMLLASLAALVIGMDEVLNTGPDQFHRGDGLILLLLFCVFLYYTASEALRGRPDEPLLEEASTTESQKPHAHPTVAGVMIIGGLGALVYGGDLVVESAVAIARRMSIPEAAIGATIVAVGTSLPELVTCIVAARKGMSDLAIGNVVGSNIFNLLSVLGITATLHPVVLPRGGGFDILAMLALSALLLPLALTRARMITRPKGLLLIAGYLGYISWQILR